MPDTCPRCEGTGRYKRLLEPEKPCAVCDGTGRIDTITLTRAQVLKLAEDAIERYEHSSECGDSQAKAIAAAEVVDAAFAELPTSEEYAP